MNETVLTPDERLSQLGDIILASVLKKDEVSKANRQHLFSQLNPKAFLNEHHIVYAVLYNFRDKGIIPDYDFMKMYLLRNEKVVREATAYIDIKAYEDLDESPIVGYVYGVLKLFKRLQGMQALGIDDFNLSVEKYKLEYQAFCIGEAYSMAKTALYDGVKMGRKTYQGYEDSTTIVKEKMAEIEGVMDSTKGAGFIDSSVGGLEDDDETQAIKIGDFGDINELNEHLGGIYAPYFYSILAPTKGGKSKFTTMMIHNIVVEHGINAVVWAHEGGYKAWWAQLRARHYDWFYNRNEPDITKHKSGVSQKIILEKTFASPAIQAAEQASRIDLFSNANYGHIEMIDRPFNVETFINEIDTAVKVNNAKVVLIDYVQLIASISGIPKSQAIGYAYQALLAYAKKKHIAIISPAQFKQEFIQDLSRSKDGKSGDTRTAGGESSEITRTPDINIALYGSVEDLAAGFMQCLSIPSRMASPFKTFGMYCDLATCLFASIEE